VRLWELELTLKLKPRVPLKTWGRRRNHRCGVADRRPRRPTVAASEQRDDEHDAQHLDGNA